MSAQLTKPAHVPSPRNAPADDKLLGVELLRFACALAVLVWHYQHLAFAGLHWRAGFVPTQQPFYLLLRPLYRYGFHGVDVFWCISGFIFLWKYGQAISRRRVSGYQFFVLRFSRLYPLHFVTLLLVAAMQQLYLHLNHSYFVYEGNDLWHFLLQLCMASNWLTWAETFNGPVWSISVEILIYGLFFLTLRYLSASPLMCGLMSALGAVVAVFWVPLLPLFFCVMYFYLGCVTAFVYQRARESRRARTVVSAAATLALAAALLARRYLHLDELYVVIVVAPALILLCTLQLQGSGRRVSRLLVAAGSMTYSSYLLHFPLQITFMTILSLLGATAPVYSPLFFLAFILVTLTLAYWCYALFEMPAQNWLRRRLLARQPVHASGNAPKIATPNDVPLA
jgi:peptidoglycan/LPS O-acetylase OafA/YrhL